MVNSENKTKCNSTTDQASISYEENLLEVDARLVTTESKKSDEAKSAAKTTNDHNSELHSNQVPWPIIECKREVGHT